jgi:hypothetical protein
MNTLTAMTSRRQESVTRCHLLFRGAHAAFAGDRVFIEKRANRTEKDKSESRKCLGCGYLLISINFVYKKQ